MCTMLCFITTDANISKDMLKKAVSADVKDSFNMISVDGDTSTNDTFLVLANGMAGNPEITTEGADFDAFCQALAFLTTRLARMIAGMGRAPPPCLKRRWWERPQRRTPGCLQSR